MSSPLSAGLSAETADREEPVVSVTFPGESAEYREARDRLLADEVELRRAMERVAAARRSLPPGGAVPEDYVFEGAGPGGEPTDVRLSELFAPGHDSLIVYSFMFPRSPGDDRPGAADGPCPSCTAFLDQLDGAAEHVTQRVSMAIVAKAPVERLLAFARERGWRHLRLVSSRANTYNRDYLAESDTGSQLPMLNVFHRDGDEPRHFWGSELFYAPADRGQDPRHTGTVEPLWNLFDLTRAGRAGDWEEQIDYCC
jgi:predicted dithiol-disulfide oxidoreductase (DUF899 family)